MIKLFFFLFCITPFGVISQIGINPTLHIGYNFSHNGSSSFFQDNYEIGAGVSISRKVNLLVYYGYMRNKYKMSQNFDIFKRNVNNVGMVAQWRVLDFKLSPAVETKIGFGLKTKNINNLIDSSYDPISSVDPLLSIGTFENYTFLTTVKLLADYRVSQFNIQLGGGYDLKQLSYVGKNSNLLFKRNLHGFVISASLQYHFTACKSKKTARRQRYLNFLA